MGTKGDTVRMGIGGVLLMPLRGVLLWVVIPLALMTWPFAAITSKLRRGSWVSARRCVRFGDAF